MQLSCLPVSLFQALDSGEMTIAQWAAYGRSLGLDAIDLMMVNLRAHTPKYLRQVREGLEQAGLGLAMITTYPDFTHPDAAQRERELDYLRRDIALAAQLGARFLRVTAGQAHPATGLREGVEWAVHGLRQADPAAAKHGVKLVYENHSKPGGWDYRDFSSPPELFLEIASRLRDTGIGINFDTANILVAGASNTLEVLEQVLDRVETIHVAETSTLGQMAPVLLGTGLAPIPAVFALLRRQGWDKWLCIEEWSNQGLEGIAKAVAYTRATWNNS